MRNRAHFLTSTSPMQSRGACAGISEAAGMKRLRRPQAAGDVADLVEQHRDDLGGALHLGLYRDDRGAADDRVVVDEALRYPHDRIRERADVGPRLERAAPLLLAIQL